MTNDNSQSNKNDDYNNSYNVYCIVREMSNK